MSGREEGVIIVVWRRAPTLEVLLLHRSRFGSGFEGDWAWTTPGGGRELDEPPAEAAARELLEETGLELHLARVPSEIVGSQPDLDVAVFAAEAPGDARIMLSDEHDEFEWVGLDGLTRCLPSWVHDAYREVLQKLALV